MMHTGDGIAREGVGIGLRAAHHAELLADDAPVVPLGFVEVHSENHFADGGAALAVLQAARQRWPLSLHGVGLGLGSVAGPDPAHVGRLARLLERVEPRFVSDHACFARAPVEPGGPVLHANDLLPVARTEAALQVLVEHVQQVQDRLRRPLLVENVSACIAWADDDIPAGEFLAMLARRSGCGLLLDVNNLVVDALNAGEGDPVRAACRVVDALAPASVGEIHLAGYHDTGEGLVIDDHGSRVHPPVWQVYEHALQRLGPKPTLIEWDTDVPPLAVLLQEADEAARRLSALRDRPAGRAAAGATFVRGSAALRP